LENENWKEFASNRQSKSTWQGIVLTHEGHAAAVDHITRAEHAVVLVLEALNEVREFRI